MSFIIIHHISLSISPPIYYIPFEPSENSNEHIYEIHIDIQQKKNTLGK